MNAVRWVLVLPAAILGGILLLFPLHWIIMASCSSPDSTVQLGNESKEGLERALTGLVAPFGFVYCGALTAPAFRRISAIALAVLLAVAAIGARVIGSEYLPEPWHWLPLLMNVLGIGGGVLAIFLRDEDRPAISNTPEQ